jgi:hypothetical protein
MCDKTPPRVFPHIRPAGGLLDAVLQRGEALLRLGQLLGSGRSGGALRALELPTRATRVLL